MTRAELENLTPYERWLVTLPDDSPELFSLPDSRVGPAPSETGGRRRSMGDVGTGISGRNQGEAASRRASAVRYEILGEGVPTSNGSRDQAELSRLLYGARAAYEPQAYPNYDPRSRSSPAYALPPVPTYDELYSAPWSEPESVPQRSDDWLSRLYGYLRYGEPGPKAEENPSTSGGLRN